MNYPRRFAVKKDDGTNLQFIGALLGSAKECHGIDGSIRYNLYSTIDREFVCQKIYTTGRSTYQTIVLDTTSDVIDFFGLDDFAKKLYDDCIVFLNVSLWRGI